MPLMHSQSIAEEWEMAAERGHNPPRDCASRAVPGPMPWIARVAAALKGHALPGSLEQPPELEPTPFLQQSTHLRGGV